ncbi:hypothetical protein K523DRAFT_370640 [Schizophyllum commune Tattone D]|nr:hypothetical protein K523DRAFT_370640 [Schizophyllum commune Tattone D]
MRMPTLAYFFAGYDLDLSRDNRSTLLFALAAYAAYDFYGATVAPVSAQLRAAFRLKGTLAQAGQMHKAPLVPGVSISAELIQRTLQYIITRAFYLVVVAFATRTAILVAMVALRTLQITSAKADRAMNGASKDSRDTGPRSDHQASPPDADDGSPQSSTRSDRGWDLPPSVSLQSFLDLAAISLVVTCVSVLCAVILRADGTPLIAGTLATLRDVIPWHAGALIASVASAACTLAVTPFTVLSIYNIWQAWRAGLPTSQIFSWATGRGSSDGQAVTSTGFKAVEHVGGGTRMRAVNGRAD